jgi:hypothetical protein
MLLSSRSFFPVVLKVSAAITLSAVALCAAVPRGWYLGGSGAGEYDSGIAQAQYHGHRVVYLKATTSTPKGFGTLMQDFRADDYAGKRVRFSAKLKAEDVANWAGLWMRVDKTTTGSSAPKILAFDNMQERPVKGTLDWKAYEVVLDVPNDATGIFFGVLLNGTGNVLMSEVKIETVGPDVATTSMPKEAPQARPNSPTNLDFAQ